MIRRSIFRHIGYLLVLCFVFSCKREEPTSWQSSLLAPIATGRITLDDIVPDTLLNYDGNCLWHLVLHEDLTDFDLDTLVKIPDTTITKGFVVPMIGGPFLVPPGQDIISQDDNNQLRLNDALMREVVVKSGTLEYTITSNIDGYVDCIYEMPGVTLDGVSTVIQTSTTPGTDANPFVTSGEIDLAGRRIDMSGQSGLLFNHIYSHLDLASSLNAPGETYVSGNDSITIELTFVNPIVQYARGYFGQYNYHLVQALDFSDQLNFPTGQLNIDQAQMNFTISNSAGVDAQIIFSDLSNYNSNTETSVTLSNSEIYQPINITRAVDLGGSIEGTNYVYQLDVQNSNIDQFIENLPDRFNLAALININPLGDVSDGNDFIYTDQVLRATLDLDIPLNVGMSSLTLTDTVAVSAGEVDLRADGLIHLLVVNTFPFSAICDLYHIDSENQEWIIATGLSLDAALETESAGVTVPVRSVLDIPVNQDMIDRFNEESRLIIRVAFNTADYNQPQGLYKDYYLDFKVVADGDVIIDYD